MVLLLVAAYLVVRALDTRDWREAVLAGLVVGFAFCVKPSNAVFFAAALAAFLIARRWRQLVYFAAALAPGLLLLALWKQRGLGTLPLFAAGDRRARSRRWRSRSPSASLAAGIGRYVNIDWQHLQREHATRCASSSGRSPARVGRRSPAARAAAALVAEGGARRRLVLRLPHRQGHRPTTLASRTRASSAS